MLKLAVVVAAVAFAFALSVRADTNEALDCASVKSALMNAAKQPRCERNTYLLGGGHGGILGKTVLPTSKLDCSSGVSLALKMAGLFASNTAWVSGNFGKWGAAGQGSAFTVWYNSGHVWIDLGNRMRLDTNASLHTRPCLEYGTRSTAGFNARHWPGC